MSETAPAVHTAAIIVNGQAKHVAGRTVSWNEVVDLAYPGQRSDPNLTFVVTYDEAAPAHGKDEGLLAEGGSVEAKERGTIFNVVSRVRS